MDFPYTSFLLVGRKAGLYPTASGCTYRVALSRANAMTCFGEQTRVFCLVFFSPQFIVPRQNHNLPRAVFQPVKEASHTHIPVSIRDSKHGNKHPAKTMPFLQFFSTE